jgi:hypothetical protein
VSARVHPFTLSRYARSMERTLLKWIKGRPGLGEPNGWPALRAPTEVVSKQVRRRDGRVYPIGMVAPCEGVEYRHSCWLLLPHGLLNPPLPPPVPR